MVTSFSCNPAWYIGTAHPTPSKPRSRCSAFDWIGLRSSVNSVCVLIDPQTRLSRIADPQRRLLKKQ
jgi:hypothetical protein